MWIGNTYAKCCRVLKAFSLGWKRNANTLLNKSSIDRNFFETQILVSLTLYLMSLFYFYSFNKFYPIENCVLERVCYYLLALLKIKDFVKKWEKK